jgi:acyl carrier protein
VPYFIMNMSTKSLSSNANELKQQVRDVVLKLLHISNDDTVLDSTDVFSLGLDSINVMTLIVTLQEVFLIVLDSNDLNFDNFQNILKITELVRKKKGF